MGYIRYLEAPFGILGIAEDGKGITDLFFGMQEEMPDGTSEEDSPLLKEAEEQLLAYFHGKLKEFSLPLSIQGTTFQKEVWGALCTIPYGEFRSYKEIASQIGKPKASRAVGGANHVNRIPILIPCHRVIGANGKMIGYAGGLPIKEYLLELERKNK